MIIHAKNGDQILKITNKDLLLIKTVLRQLRSLIIAFIEHGAVEHKKHSQPLEHFEKNQIRNIIINCLPQKIKPLILAKKKNNNNIFSFISFHFSFRKNQQIQINHQQAILMKINEVIAKESNKLISKIPQALKKRQSRLNALEKSKLKLKKRVSGFINPNHITK